MGRGAFYSDGPFYSRIDWETSVHAAMEAENLGFDSISISDHAAAGDEGDHMSVGQCAGFTFGGNPVACAAVLKNIDIIKREKLPERSLKLGEYLKGKLAALNHKIIGDVRGLGLLIGVELVRDRQTKEIFPDHQQVAADVASRFFRKGVKIFGLKGHSSGMISDFLIVSPHSSSQNKS